MAQDLITTVTSPGGSFDPLVYLVAMMFSMLIAYFIWDRFGYNGYKKNTEQTKVFLCGHDEPAPEEMHIPAGSIYWGFFASLKKYFGFLKKEHTGLPSDYTAWFVLGTALIGIVMLIWGV